MKRQLAISAALPRRSNGKLASKSVVSLHDLARQTILSRYPPSLSLQSSSPQLLAARLHQQAQTRALSSTCPRNLRSRSYDSSATTSSTSEDQQSQGLAHGDRQPQASSSRHVLQDSPLPESSSQPSALTSAPSGTSAHTQLRKPTKEELLSVAGGFLERLRIRFKWLTIRGMRPYRADDWSAFISWVLSGVGIWIAVGTTSFMAAVFLLLNSLQMQEWVGQKLGDYLTSSSGVSVVFDSAIVPRFSWKDSKISFKHVAISRGAAPQQQPGDHPSEPDPPPPLPTYAPDVVAASPDEATVLDKFRQRTQTLVRASLREQSGHSQQTNFDPKQHTAFSITVDTIDVTLSLPRWLDGKGIIKDAVVKGVRGTVDRSNIEWDPNTPTDRTAYRHTSAPGDFHLESLVLEDFLVTIHQPENFRPYTWSIFSAHIPTLRKQWLFLDLMSAESIVGQVDNCLFSLHRPQFIHRTNIDESEAAASPETKWKRLSRFRIDGVNIDHLKSSRDSGPLSWITSGQCDLVADIRFPKVEEHDSFEAIIGDIADRFDEMLQGQQIIPGQKELSGGKAALEAPQPRTRRFLGLEVPEQDREMGPMQPCVLMDLSIRFKDIKATIPIFHQDLTYVNSALIRPIVAFLNANRTLIPIKCRVELPISEFDGSWTTYDTGILDAMGEQVYLALAYHIQNSNDRRARQVGLWSLQLTARSVINAIRSWNEREGTSSPFSGNFSFA